MQQVLARLAMLEQMLEKLSLGREIRDVEVDKDIATEENKNVKDQFDTLKTLILKYYDDDQVVFHDASARFLGQAMNFPSYVKDSLVEYTVTAQENTFLVQNDLEPDQIVNAEKLEEILKQC